MANASHLSLMAIAYIIAGCSAVLTGIFGSTFGGESSVLTAICFLMFFCMSLLSPLLFNALTKSVLQRNVGKIVIFSLFGVFFFSTDVLTNAGTVALFRKADLVRTDNQNDRAKNARSEVRRLEKRISEIRSQTLWQTSYLSPDAYDPLIKAKRLQRENEEKKRGGCGIKCEGFQSELGSLLADQQNARTRLAQKAEMFELERELKDAKVAAAETPTQASAALEHARNVAAGFTGQMDPDNKSRFWANYGLSAWGGLATSLAAIASAILLAASGAVNSRREYDEAPEARNPYLEDMRPALSGGSLSQAYVLQEGDGVEAMKIALRRLDRRFKMGEASA